MATKTTKTVSDLSTVTGTSAADTIVVTRSVANDSIDLGAGRTHSSCAPLEIR